MEKQPQDVRTLEIPTFLASATAKYLEDAQAKDGPIAADAILTDQQLERSGLVKVEAFMRTRTSAAAARKAKQREKQEATGLKQTNLIAPVAVHEPLRAIAKTCTEGKSIEDAIKIAVPSVTSPALVTPEPKTITVEKIIEVEKIDPDTERLAAIGRRVQALQGWKRRIAHLLKLI